MSQGKVLFVDVETIGNNPRSPDCELLMTGWKLGRQGETRMDLGQPGPELQALLLDSKVVVASHTLYDAGWLTHEGTWHDTRVMAWCVNENTPLDLDWLTKRYTGIEMDKRLRPVANRILFKDDRGKDWDLALYHEWPEHVQAEFIAYCRRDVDALAMLYFALGDALIETEQLAYWHEEEVPYTNICIEMERNGLPVNLEDTETLAVRLRAARDASEEQLRRTSRVPAAFNLGSPDQVADYLFSRWFKVKDRIPITPEQRTTLRKKLEGHEALVPHMFEVSSIGTKYLNGSWVVRGRGLAPTPPTKRKLPNGETVEGKHPSTSTPDLMYKHANDAFVRELCLTHRRLGRLLVSYLEKFPRVAVETSASHAGQGTGEDNFGRRVGEDNLGKLAAVPVAGPLVSTRIHGRYNQGGTVTGRLSSSDPNLQNIPSRHEWGDAVRALFQGNFLIGDYDALEMRIMAHLSGDRELIRIFDQGLDPHVRTAYALFGVEVDHDDPRRGIGKTINYGVGYGAGAKKLAQVLSLEGYATKPSVAKDYLEVVQGFYKGFFKWGEREKWRAKDGGRIETMAGRVRHLKGSFKDGASWKATSYGERQTVNSEVQGSAADIIRRGMLEVRRRVPELDPLAQIHDEAIWEWYTRPSARVIKLVQWCMEKGHGFDMRVPLIFEPYVCSDWSQKGEGSSIELLEDEARKV